MELGFPTCPSHATGEPSTIYRTPLGNKPKATAPPHHRLFNTLDANKARGAFQHPKPKRFSWMQSTPSVYKCSACPGSKIIDASQLNAEIALKGGTHCLSTLIMSSFIKLKKFKRDGTENVNAWFTILCQLAQCHYLPASKVINAFLFYLGSH